ncbi:hypothetical protein [Virgibacillus halodenitrificans]|nr:hypothetical protein [Virgibacillus halodenitrificans]
MNSQIINQTVESLAEYVQHIIEEGSDEELQLLPELVNALARLQDVS